jgi:hypothetical protein
MMSNIGRNPIELKRRDQSREGYVWFATYDHQLMHEDELRKVLSSPDYGMNENSFPKVNEPHVISHLGNCIDSYSIIRYGIW